MNYELRSTQKFAMILTIRNTFLVNVEQIKTLPIFSIDTLTGFVQSGLSCHFGVFRVYGSLKII